jgi:hypothetical protein
MPPSSKGSNMASPSRRAVVRRAERSKLANRTTPFLWVFAVTLSIALIVSFGVWLKVRTHRDPAWQPAAPLASVAENPPPVIHFTDITQQSGIHFVHTNGATGERLLPETMGGGCAFFDYDNDGSPDLLLINSRSWNQTSAGDAKPTMALYHNGGKGHFTDATVGSGLDVSLYGMGVAVGDFDNDGLVDVFITAVGGNHLFRNLGGGKFEDVTAKSGVGGEGGWSTSAAFVDVDNDGHLDLFVCNYVRWTAQTDASQEFIIPGVGRAYGPPLAFAGTSCQLYHNNGDGTFTDISQRAGIRVIDPTTGRPMAKSLAVAPIDLDDDGWIDLIVANDTTPNFVFHNRGDGTFEEIGLKTGLALGNTGETRGAMGIDAAFFRNDDTLGVAVGNFAEELNALYMSQGTRRSMTFRDEAMSTGVGPPTRHVLTFGLFFFDADLDGRLDLLMVNGHIEPSIDLLHTAQTYRQRPTLLWNQGKSSSSDTRTDFIPLTEKQCGDDLFLPIAGRGAAYADVDGDGDLDLLITQIGGPPRLLRNDQKLGNHWLRVKLLGNPARHVNRDAIGAWVEVFAGDRRIRRQVMPTRSYLSQVELPATIGLGAATHVDRMIIHWPDGSHEELPVSKVDTLLVVKQGASLP